VSCDYFREMRESAGSSIKLPESWRRVWDKGVVERKPDPASAVARIPNNNTSAEIHRKEPPPPLV